LIRTVQIRQSDGDTSSSPSVPKFPMTRPAAAGLIWGLLVVIAVALVARATYTPTCRRFCPATERGPDPPDRAVAQRPRGRLILVALEGADALTRAHLSAQLARELRSDPRFIAVNNGDAASSSRAGVSVSPPLPAE